MGFLHHVLSISCLLSSLADCQNPRGLQFAQDRFFGADGPWQAIKAQPGSSQVYLYPGGSLASQVLSTGFCQNSGSPNCAAAAGGFYTPSSSATGIFSNDGTDQYGGGNATNVTATSLPVLDNLSLGLDEGDTHTIPGFDLVVLNSSVINLPNGSTYPSDLGFFSLGGPGLNQTFGTGSDQLVANYSTGWLYQTGITSSASYGLHIGSVPFNLPGSLIFGGFDQNRVIGEVGVFEYLGQGGFTQVNLIDLILGVEEGGWPFGALAVNSSLFNHSAPAVTAEVNPSVPYLILPTAICTALATKLPITFDPNINLYTWNTDDPNFAKIVTSPAYLQFVFETTVSSNFTLKVPFALLNLTLASPIVATPRQYFPCKPYDVPDSNHFNQLGRAFLQAVFLGQNFNSQKMFLAQAPGPGAAPNSLVALSPTATSFSGQPSSDFGLSWSNIWTPLPVDSNTPTSSLQPSETASGSSSSDLSTGAKAGIGVGVAVGAIGLLVGAVLILRMKRERARSLQAQNGPGYQLPTALYSDHADSKLYNPPEARTHELPTDTHDNTTLGRELPASNSPQELSSQT